MIHSSLRITAILAGFALILGGCGGGSSASKSVLPSAPVQSAPNGAAPAAAVSPTPAASRAPTAAPNPTASPNPTVTEFPIASGDSGPKAITVAPNGNAWFLSANAVNQTNVAGTVTPHTDPHFFKYNSGTDITVGPDGALWFTANCAEVTGPEFPLCGNSFLVNLARITLTGTITDVASAGDTSEGVFQSGIVSGPDNTISAIVGVGETVGTNGSGYQVVKTDGTQLLFKTLPQPCLNGGGGGATTFGFYNASGIARGADGAFYIAATPPCVGLQGAPPNAVLRVDASGTFTNTFIVPDAQSVAAGPDGNLWITQNGPTNAIARMTPTGVITEFPLPTANAGPLGIAAGNDGAIWFTENSASKIGRITTSGKITEFATPTAGAGPFGIASLLGECGPGHGRIWFTENVANKIGRVDF